MPLLGPSWDRFWSKVDTSGDCWEWTGRMTAADGYGGIKVLGEQAAHRVSWVIHHGPVPDGLWVLHHCDNRKCVRPDHLYLGTVQDNNRDAVTRGRMRRGPVKTKDIPVMAPMPVRPARYTVNRWAEAAGLVDARLASRIRRATPSAHRTAA